MEGSEQALGRVGVWNLPRTGVCSLTVALESRSIFIRYNVRARAKENLDAVRTHLGLSKSSINKR